MDMVRITSVSDFESLPLNRWSIPEPPLDQERENGKRTSVMHYCSGTNVKK